MSGEGVDVVPPPDFSSDEDGEVSENPAIVRRLLVPDPLVNILKCIKCNSTDVERPPPGQGKLTRGDCYCRACWKEHVAFRVLRRIRQIGYPPAPSGNGTREEVYEKVLVVYDRTIKSSALLNLVHQSVVHNMAEMREKKQGRRIPYVFCILYIAGKVFDPYPIPDPNRKAEELDSIRNVLNWIQRDRRILKGLMDIGGPEDFKLFVTSLEQGLPPPVYSPEYDPPTSPMVVRVIENDQEDRNKYRNCMDTTDMDNDVVRMAEVQVPLDRLRHRRVTDAYWDMKTSTAQQNFLDVMVMRTVKNVADSLGIKKVFLPTTQDMVASSLLSYMSLGRGGQVTSQVAFSAEWNDLMLYRPIVDFTEHDLSRYLSCPDASDIVLNEHVNLENQFLFSPLAGPSLQDLCTQFTHQLQLGFPSTVSTLARIGEKLQPMKTEGTSCPFCLNMRDGTARDREDIGIWCHGCNNISREMRDPAKLFALVDAYLPVPFG